MFTNVSPPCLRRCSSWRMLSCCPIWVVPRCRRAQPWACRWRITLMHSSPVANRPTASSRPRVKQTQSGVGAKPQCADLIQSVNELEATEDVDGRWRRYINQASQENISTFFGFVDLLILLAASCSKSFLCSPYVPSVTGARLLKFHTMHVRYQKALMLSDGLPTRTSIRSSLSRRRSS
jgi:hypothetical protein